MDDNGRHPAHPGITRGAGTRSKTLSYVVTFAHGSTRVVEVETTRVNAGFPKAVKLAQELARELGRELHSVAYTEEV